MQITYTPQHNYESMIYNNDIENEIIKVTLNDTQVIERDLSHIVEGQTEGDEEPERVGFPVVGMPKRIDGELHVTLIEWYR